MVSFISKVSLHFASITVCLLSYFLIDNVSVFRVFSILLAMLATQVLIPHFRPKFFFWKTILLLSNYGVFCLIVFCLPFQNRYLWLHIGISFFLNFLILIPKRENKLIISTALADGKKEIFLIQESFIALELYSKKNNIKTWTWKDSENDFQKLRELFKTATKLGIKTKKYKSKFKISDFFPKYETKFSKSKDYSFFRNIKNFKPQKIILGGLKDWEEMKLLQNNFPEIKIALLPDILSKFDVFKWSLGYVSNLNEESYKSWIFEEQIPEICKLMLLNGHNRFIIKAPQIKNGDLIRSIWLYKYGNTNAFTWPKKSLPKNNEVLPNEKSATCAMLDKSIKILYANSK